MSQDVPEMHSDKGRLIMAAIFLQDIIVRSTSQALEEHKSRVIERNYSDEDAGFELEALSAAVHGVLAIVETMSTVKDEALSNPDNDRGRQYLALAEQLLLFKPESAGEKVYFQSDGEYVKIGRTIRSEARRRKENQTGNPRTLTTLIVIPNGCEKKIQARFKADHVRGEWYRMSPDLNEFIRSWQMVEVAF